MDDFNPNEGQYGALKFMMEKSFGMLMMDAGTRKTSSVLYAYKLLRDAGFVKRLLVPSTVNVVDNVWPAEIEKWKDLDLTYSFMRGGEKKRRRAYELDADVYLINVQNVPWLLREYGKRLDFDMLYVDEISEVMRNRNTYFQALKRALPSFKRRYGGTATPMPKGYMNLWPQYYVVDRGLSLGDTITSYRNRYFYPSGYKGKEWSLRDGADAEIQHAIAPRTYRCEKRLDVTIEFVTRKIEIPSRAMNAYKELEQEFILEWQGKTITAATAGTATTKLRQAANGALYYERMKKGKMQRAFVELHAEKANDLKKCMKEVGEPMLIAYEFDHDYEMMLKHGIKIPSYSWAKRGQEREDLKDAWNAGRLKGGLCGNIAAMAHGLNVQFGGRYLYYYGLAHNLEHYTQFYNRLWRDGQEYDVTAFQCVADGTIEDTIVDVLAARHYDQMTLLNAIKRRYELE